MIDEITTIISTVGFPIVISILMFNNNSKFIIAIQDLTVTLKGMDTRLEIIEKERIDKNGN